jgi:hypothetical protein
LPEYRPLKSPGKSPIKPSIRIPARKGRALFVDDEPEEASGQNLFSSYEKNW